MNKGLSRRAEGAETGPPISPLALNKTRFGCAVVAVGSTTFSEMPFVLVDFNSLLA